MFELKETLKYLEELVINETKISEDKNKLRADYKQAAYHRGVAHGLRDAILIIQRDVLYEDV